MDKVLHIAMISFEYTDGWKAQELLKSVFEEMSIEDVANVISSTAFWERGDREFLKEELEKSLCPKT